MTPDLAILNRLAAELSAADVRFTPSRRNFLLVAAAAAALQVSCSNGVTQGPAPAVTTSPIKGKRRMSTITTKDGTELYYRDWGSGQPVLFSHGWPVTGDGFDVHMFLLASRGARGIALERRGTA